MARGEPIVVALLLVWHAHGISTRLSVLDSHAHTVRLRPAVSTADLVPEQRRIARQSTAVEKLIGGAEAETLMAEAQISAQEKERRSQAQQEQQQKALMQSSMQTQLQTGMLGVMPVPVPLMQQPQKPQQPQKTQQPQPNAAPDMPHMQHRFQTDQPLIFADKVSPEFQKKVKDICAELGIPDPNFLMAAMAFETGQTFDPKVKNKVSGATGLIQFMPSTAKHLGTTTTALAGMTAEAQLDFVKKFFLRLKGKLQSIEDVYMAILYPVAVGKPNSFVLFEAPKKTYEQNKGLDINKDGKVTKEEAASKVKALYKGGATAAPASGTGGGTGGGKPTGGGGKPTGGGKSRKTRLKIEACAVNATKGVCLPQCTNQTVAIGPCKKGKLKCCARDFKMGPASAWKNQTQLANQTQLTNQTQPRQARDPSIPSTPEGGRDEEDGPGEDEDGDPEEMRQRIEELERKQQDERAQLDEQRRSMREEEDMLNQRRGELSTDEVRQLDEQLAQRREDQHRMEDEIRRQHRAAREQQELLAENRLERQRQQQQPTTTQRRPPVQQPQPQTRAPDSSPPTSSPPDSPSPPESDDAPTRQSTTPQASPQDSPRTEPRESGSQED